MQCKHCNISQGISERHFCFVNILTEDIRKLTPGITKMIEDERKRTGDTTAFRNLVSFLELAGYVGMFCLEKDDSDAVEIDQEIYV